MIKRGLMIITMVLSLVAPAVTVFAASSKIMSVFDSSETIKTSSNVQASSSSNRATPRSSGNSYIASAPTDKL